MPNMSPYSLVQDGRLSQYPASNRGMIDAQTALCHQLFQVTITERIAEIPAHALHDHLFLEVPSLEYRWSGPSHSVYTLATPFPSLRHYPATVFWRSFSELGSLWLGSSFLALVGFRWITE